MTDGVTWAAAVRATVTRTRNQARPAGGRMATVMARATAEPGSRLRVGVTVRCYRVGPRAWRPGPGLAVIVWH